MNNQSQLSFALMTSALLLGASSWVSAIQFSFTPAYSHQLYQVEGVNGDGDGTGSFEHNLAVLGIGVKLKKTHKFSFGAEWTQNNDDMKLIGRMLDLHPGPAFQAGSLTAEVYYGANPSYALFANIDVGSGFFGLVAQKTTVDLNLDLPDFPEDVEGPLSYKYTTNPYWLTGVQGGFAAPINSHLSWQMLGRMLYNPSDITDHNQIDGIKTLGDTISMVGIQLQAGIRLESGSKKG
jgi:hypothetical protein